MFGATAYRAMQSSAATLVGSFDVVAVAVEEQSQLVCVAFCCGGSAHVSTLAR
jgi:hypothetical protein